MQTFVPFDDFDKSAQVLDSKRLNKQLLEGRQIYGILASGKRTGAWVNHPAVNMWRNYDMSLFNYLYAIKDECDYRGIKTENNWNAILDIHEKNWYRGNNVVMPPWWGDDRVHLSHQGRLYEKSPDEYMEFYTTYSLGWKTCCNKCTYFWPTHTNQYAAKFAGYIVN